MALQWIKKYLNFMILTKWQKYFFNNNKYARQKAVNNWIDIDTNDMKKFIGLCNENESSKVANALRLLEHKWRIDSNTNRSIHHNED